MLATWREKYPGALFVGMMQYRMFDRTGERVEMTHNSVEFDPARNIAHYVPRIKCLDCPGNIYLPEKFEDHLLHDGHRANVQVRLGKVTDPISTTNYLVPGASSTDNVPVPISMPPSFKLKTKYGDIVATDPSPRSNDIEAAFDRVNRALESTKPIPPPDGLIPQSSSMDNMPPLPQSSFLHKIRSSSPNITTNLSSEHHLGENPVRSSFVRYDQQVLSKLSEDPNTHMDGTAPVPASIVTNSEQASTDSEAFFAQISTQSNSNSTFDWLYTSLNEPGPEVKGNGHEENSVNHVKE